MKYVMTYRAAEDFLPLAREHGSAHVARLHQFHDRGVLLMAGPVDEPMGPAVERGAADRTLSPDGGSEPGHDAAAPFPRRTSMARLLVSGRPCALAGPRCRTSARSEQCPKEQ